MAQSICGSAITTNVAPFDCDAARAFPKKLIIGSRGFTPSETLDSAAFRTALLAATKLDTGSANKLYAIHDLRNPTDTSSANTTGAVGEGAPQILAEGIPSFTYQVVIGQDLFKRLRKLNKQTVPIFTYDDAKNLWGAKEASGNFVGAKATFFISGNTQQTASTPVSALITLSYLSATQYNDDSYYMPVTLSGAEPEGLLDGFLEYVSNSTNVFKIAFRAPTAQINSYINLASVYSAQLVAGLFSAATGTTYQTALAITSVAYDAATSLGSTVGVLTVTFDSTAYNALTNGAKIRLKLAIVASLDAANITGVEGVPVILTKS